MRYQSKNSKSVPDVRERACSYVAAMPAAVSGQGGHNQTFAVACVLVQGFGLSAEEALPILREYNQRCQPPWSEKDLLHKLEGAEQAQPPPQGRGCMATGSSPSLTFEHHKAVAKVKDEHDRAGWLKKADKHGLSTRRLRKSILLGHIARDHELRSPAHKPQETHLLWIQRMVQWWAKVQDDPAHRDMSREQLEAVLWDFEPVLAIVEQLRERAEQAKAVLEN